MANTKDFKLKRDNCREAFLDGKNDPADLAVIFGVAEITVKKWIKAGHWEELGKEEKRLDREIRQARKKALIQALREYARNPGDTALQSLVSLIKHDRKDSEPARELHDYIVKFLDQSTDFMIERGHETLLKLYQEILIDLADYLRLKNG